MTKYIIVILSVFFSFQLAAQKVEPPVLKNRLEDFVLSPGKNSIMHEFFYNDSIWITFESNDFYIHSFVISIKKSRNFNERFYANKGVLKGAAIKSIIFTALPFEIKISELKIKFNDEFIVLPDEYILIVQ
ncbi:MAG: hypothetical protein ACK4K9_10795 [Bacteroidia bacterium]